MTNQRDFLNLGVLVLFKYTGFLAESFNAIFGTAVPVPAIRIPSEFLFHFRPCPTSSTFTVGVTVPQKNFGKKVLSLISFFPQLIGPGPS